MIEIGKFIVLEINDLTKDKANFGFFGLVLRKYDSYLDDIYYCCLYESNMPGIVLEPGDIVIATLEQESSPLGEYNYEDNYVKSIKLINKLKWIRI